MPPLYKLLVGVETTITVYPDADPELTSVDGQVRRSWQDDVWSGESFSAIRNGAGTHAEDDASPIGVMIQTGTSDEWKSIFRGIFLFDTAAIPPGAIITLATLGVHLTTHIDQFTQTYAINVFSSTPASNTALVAADYGQLGSTPLATKKTIDSLTDDAWSIFTLNGAGRAAIAKGGITKLGIREANFDAPFITPTWEGPALQASVYIKSADDPDSTKKPYLTITYRI